jgi:CRP-like cAMP-binding protein
MRTIAHRWPVGFGPREARSRAPRVVVRSLDTKRNTQIKLPLTHEEIAECIGTTRETVTRALGEFKNRNLVAMQGSTLMISDRAALETIGGA